MLRLTSISNRVIILHLYFPLTFPKLFSSLSICYFDPFVVMNPAEVASNQNLEYDKGSLEFVDEGLQKVYDKDKIQQKLL